MEEKDEQLWRIAKKRAGFKKQLASYIIVNGFLWGVWWFTSGRRNDEGGYWPIWCCLGWGIGLAFSYYDAYHDSREQDTIKEYQKLKDQQGK
jgi:hypothetical protein